MMNTAPLPVSRFNHVTLVVKNVEESVKFYEQVLGFVEIRRPDSFDSSDGCQGAWLWREGMGIHLISGAPVARSQEINIFADHLSFQPAENTTLEDIENCLRIHGVKYVQQTVREGDGGDGLMVPQIFFHDPDHNLLEICPCDCIPVRPVRKSRSSTDSDGSVVVFRMESRGDQNNNLMFE